MNPKEEDYQQFISQLDDVLEEPRRQKLSPEALLHCALHHFLQQAEAGNEDGMTKALRIIDFHVISKTGIPEELLLNFFQVLCSNACSTTVTKKIRPFIIGKLLPPSSQLLFNEEVLTNRKLKYICKVYSCALGNWDLEQERRVFHRCIDILRGLEKHESTAKNSIASAITYLLEAILDYMHNTLSASDYTELANVILQLHNRPETFQMMSILINLKFEELDTQLVNKMITKCIDGLSEPIDDILEVLKLMYDQGDHKELLAGKLNIIFPIIISFLKISDKEAYEENHNSNASTSLTQEPQKATSYQDLKEVEEPIMRKGAAELLGSMAKQFPSETEALVIAEASTLTQSSDTRTKRAVAYSIGMLANAIDIKPSKDNIDMLLKMIRYEECKEDEAVECVKRACWALIQIPPPLLGAEGVRGFLKHICKEVTASSCTPAFKVIALSTISPMLDMLNTISNSPHPCSMMILETLLHCIFNFRRLEAGVYFVFNVMNMTLPLLPTDVPPGVYSTIEQLIHQLYMKAELVHWTSTISSLCEMQNMQRMIPTFLNEHLLPTLTKMVASKKVDEQCEALSSLVDTISMCFQALGKDALRPYLSEDLFEVLFSMSKSSDMKAKAQGLATFRHFQTLLLGPTPEWFKVKLPVMMDQLTAVIANPEDCKITRDQAHWSYATLVSVLPQPINLNSTDSIIDDVIRTNPGSGWNWETLILLAARAPQYVVSRVSEIFNLLCKAVRTGYITEEYTNATIKALTNLISFNLTAGSFFYCDLSCFDAKTILSVNPKRRRFAEGRVGDATNVTAAISILTHFEEMPLELRCAVGYILDRFRSWMPAAQWAILVDEFVGIKKFMQLSIFPSTPAALADVVVKLWK